MTGRRYNQRLGSKRTPRATKTETIWLDDNFAEVQAADKSRTSDASWSIAWDSAHGNEKAARIYAALVRSAT